MPLTVQSLLQQIDLVFEGTKLLPFDRVGLFLPDMIASLVAAIASASG
jgi:hypothetical protein